MTGLFLPALRDAMLDVPPGLTDGAGRPAGRRFAVYRNNVAVSLTDALETGFPCLFRLLGAENFRPLARMFVDRHLPASPLMMQYGAGFDAHLAGFRALDRFPYLPDMARLELALRESYHAADATPMDPSRLAVADLEALRLSFAPAVRLIRSDWPLHAIWTHAMAGGPTPSLTTGPAAQSVLITRPVHDPVPHALTPAEGTFVAALMADDPLGAAFAAAQAQDPAFDPTPALTLLVTEAALTDMR